MSPQSRKKTENQAITGNENEKPGKLLLNSDQMAQLLSLAPDVINENSPLPQDMDALPVDQNLMGILAENAWLGPENNGEIPELSESALNAISALVSPGTSVQVVLGSPKEMAITQLYSADRYQDDKLVIYTYREERDVHVIDPCQSPSDVSDALLVQLLNGPHLEGMNFELSFSETDLIAYLTILDLVYARQLEAKLNHTNFPILNFNADDIFNLFQEIRLGEDLLWCSALIPYLFPYLDPALNEKRLKSSIKNLQKSSLISASGKSSFQPNDFTIALAEGLLPIVSFGSCAINTAADTGMHIGFIIGLNVNLAVKAAYSKDSHEIQLTGMDGVQLSRLLFEIGIPMAD